MTTKKAGFTKNINKQTRLIESYTLASKNTNEKTKKEIFEEILLMKKLKQFAHKKLKTSTNIYFMNFLNKKISQYYKILGQMK